MQISRSGTYLTNLLRRIEHEFRDSPLFIRTGKGEKTELTEAGRSLLRTTLRGINRIEGQPSRLYVAASSSLVTNGVLGRAVTAFQADDADSLHRGEGRLQFRLQLRTRVEPSLLRREIVQRKLDLAIVFDTPERQINPRDELEIRPLHHPFDLVFISHDMRLIEEINRIIASSDEATESARTRRWKLLQDAIADRRPVVLPIESQPMAEQLRLKAAVEPQDVVTVDTFDAAAAMVAAKVGDYGLIPVFYPRFDQLWSRGELHRSQPVDRHTVLSIQRKDRPARRAAEALLGRLEERLKVVTQPGTRHAWSALPSSLSQFEKNIHYGYYIEGQHSVSVETSGAASNVLPPFKWQWETVEWQRKGDQLVGTIANCEGDSFDVRAYLANAVFIVEASGVNTRRSVPDFVSIFTQATKPPLRLLGVWTSAKNPSVLNATILSEQRLGLTELQALQQAAFCSVLASDECVPLDDQP